MQSIIVNYITSHGARRFRRCLFWATAVALLANSSWARPWRPDQIPNGYANDFAFVCANCHVNPNGGGPRNSFGEAVEAELVRLYGTAVNNREPFWSAVLAALDSDGDGFANGEELGDAQGSWTPGSPDPQGQVFHPGDPASHPALPTNAPPSVILTAPAPGSTFNAPATLTLTATAHDTDGSVTAVEFFDGALSLGSGSTSPYSIATTLTLPGSHLLKAVATDNLGAASTSSVVAVTIQGSGGQVPGVMETFSFANLNRPVPDANAAGMSDRRTVSTAIATINALRVRLRLSGEFVGDLYGYLRHVQNGTTHFCVLLNRPGRTASSPWGYPGVGLDVTIDDAAVNGNLHTYQDVVVPRLGTRLNGTWRPDGRAVDPASVLDTSPATTTFASFNGANPDGEWTLFLADLDSGATNLLESWELEISGPAVPVVAWPQPADFVYGTALGPAQLNATASVPGSFSYSPASGTVLNAGAAQTLAVIFTPADLSTYVPVTATVSVNVLRRPLTITASSATKVFGAPLPAPAATYAGLVNGDNAASLDTPPTLAHTATVTSPVGVYSITVTGAADANYVITRVNGALTITSASTAGLVNSSANPSLPGQSVAFTFQATAVPPGAGVPTGAVQFKANGANLGTPVPLLSGVANRSIATLTHGLHTITAEYAGDGNFRGTTNSLAQAQLVNTPPLAGPDTIDRGLTNGTKALISGLLANDSDADGDALELVSVSTRSVSGGVVTNNGGWVFYTPPAFFTNEDSFTYTIADTYGVTTPGTVRLMVQPDTGLAANIQITDLGNGSYLLLFDGIPGTSYRIESSEEVGRQDWHPLGNRTANAVGAFEFIDTPPDGLPRRFYRSVRL